MRKAFGKEKLEETFREIGKRLERPLGVFLFGGGAMCFRNQKTATKDLDLVFKNDADYETFYAVIEKIGFRKDGELETEYRKMMAAGVWREESGFRFDLFVRTVCNALELNERIIARSESLGKFEKLEVRMVSNEDVILFKGITERLDDADDIAAIVRTAKIDWDVILEECTLQSKKRAWYGLLYNKLVEIKEKHGINAPIIRQLTKLNKQMILKEAYDNLRKGGASRKEALEMLRKNGFTKNELDTVD
jgi:hypothetical protein